MKKKGVITQTSVHVKLDNDIFERLDAFCLNEGFKRNRAFNFIIDHYLEYFV